MHRPLIYLTCVARQGRVMADVFIYPRNEGCAFPHPVFLLECPASEQANLMAHMQKYKLRAKVTIRAANEYAAWGVWGPNATDRLWWRHQVNETDAARLPPGQLVKRDGVGFADIGMTDTRASQMGFRVVRRNDDTSCKWLACWIVEASGVTDCASLMLSSASAKRVLRVESR